MKPLYDMLLSLHNKSLLETDEADEAFNVTENKTRVSLKWEVWELENESFMKVWSNGRNESEKREWDKRNERKEMIVWSNSEFLANNNSV